MEEFNNKAPLIPPSPVIQPSLIDLEIGSSEQIQCRICLESQGRDFIAPCKCKGTSKYVHRECLDQWRSVKEGFAFSHCTTCKAPYYLKAHALADRKWRTLKFQFFVTRDMLFIFLAIQLVITSLGYLVYMVDGFEDFRLQNYLGFKNDIGFYYICGAVLFFALLGLAGCLVTCFDERVRNDLALPCNELCLCCCHPGSGTATPSYYPGNLYVLNNGGVCCEGGAFSGDHCGCCVDGCCDGCTSAAGECGSCVGDAGEPAAPLLFIVALVGLGLFAVVGIFYSVLAATMVGQRIWQRHYHILAKRMLTKDYVVEDVGDKITGSDWSPPPLPAEHVQQLNALGLL